MNSVEARSEGKRAAEEVRCLQGNQAANTLEYVLERFGNMNTWHWGEDNEAFEEDDEDQYMSLDVNTLYTRFGENILGEAG